MAVPNTPPDDKTDPNILFQIKPPVKDKGDFDEDEKTDPGIIVKNTTPPAPKLGGTTPTRNTPPNEVSAIAIRNSKKMPDLGILMPLLRDPAVTEIMVNDLQTVMIERGGRIEAATVPPFGEDEIQRIIRNILDATGKYISQEQPYVDASLPDGSRVNIVIPPVAVDGPGITIRKFPDKRLTIQDLITVDALDKRMAFFLKACVVARMNIIVSGGTGSGKTTLLNVLSHFIPAHERVVLIEDTPEISLHRTNRVRLQSKPQTPSSPAISARELVANSLRMRPDRIVVGECRREEAFDMLQAMNTGHSGSMTTIHANTPRDALARLESLAMMAGLQMPLLAIRKQLTSAVDFIVQIQRFRNGERKVVAITEITGMESDTTTLQDIFLFQSNAEMPHQTENGVFRATGYVPSCIDQFKEWNVEFPANFFI